MICPYCLKDFEPEHKLQKYCDDKHRKKFARRKQSQMRHNPFNGMEPTDNSSFYHREDERRKTRRNLRER